MGRQMKAEREKRATILDAEAVRQAQILRSEGEKQAAILQAEGRREAAYRDAEARERMAEAEAQATHDVSEAIAEGNLQAVNYFVAQKYVDAIGKFARSRSEKVLFLPMEASTVIDTIGGIARLADAANGPDAAGQDAGKG
jgi:regulator of protease activity HflC (stomatin/prohibitin superfamily)